MEDVEESILSRMPNSLHILRAGKEIPTDFKTESRPLRLFVPALSLSPDAKFLITVAPIYEILKAWEQYQPFDEQFRLKSGHVQERSLMAYSLLRPEQYVIVDFETGSVSPLIDAPAGRGMGYYNVPTEAFWFGDSRHAVLTNTYLPVAAPRNAEMSRVRLERPMVTMVDVSTKAVQKITDLRLPNSAETARWYGMVAIIWDGTTQAVTLRYKSMVDAPISHPPTPDA